MNFFTDKAKKTKIMSLLMLAVILVTACQAPPTPIPAKTDSFAAVRAHIERLVAEGEVPSMAVAVASRTDPSLALSRLRAGGQMTEIRADDLRFTLDKVATFLDKAMGLDLSAENVAALETRTEGWIAGLQLAALSMQGLKRICPASFHDQASIRMQRIVS